MAQRAERSVTEPQACQGEGLLHENVGTGRKGRGHNLQGFFPLSDSFQAQPDSSWRPGLVLALPFLADVQ